jgi:hypothetical protein
VRVIRLDENEKVVGVDRIAGLPDEDIEPLIADHLPSDDIEPHDDNNADEN